MDHHDWVPPQHGRCGHVAGGARGGQAPPLFTTEIAAVLGLTELRAKESQTDGLPRQDGVAGTLFHDLADHKPGPVHLGSQVLLADSRRVPGLWKAVEEASIGLLPQATAADFHKHTALHNVQLVLRHEAQQFHEAQRLRTQACDLVASVGRNLHNEAQQFHEAQRLRIQACDLAASVGWNLNHITSCNESEGQRRRRMQLEPARMMKQAAAIDWMGNDRIMPSSTFESPVEGLELLTPLMPSVPHSEFTIDCHWGHRSQSLLPNGTRSVSSSCIWMLWNKSHPGSLLAQMLR